MPWADTVGAGRTHRLPVVLPLACGEPAAAVSDDGAQDALVCRVCGTPGRRAGEIVGKYSGRRFELVHCAACGFSFIANPWLDYDAIYSEEYYNGRGADPLVNYVEEAEQPERSLRRYEWEGILDRIRALAVVDGATSWLDYGCGVGGLVAFLRAHGVPRAMGFEQGWAVPRLVDRGIPVVGADHLEEHAGSFDVLTAIEVIEHARDPVDELRRMRDLLKPGGLLFLTTGNAEPFRDRIAAWRYVLPEVHLSYFEPRSLGLALQKAGFLPTFPGWGPGWSRIIRFKILKQLGRHRVSAIDAAVPWGIVTRFVDWRLKVTAQPVGWALSVS
jgi:SAM-dependent methyltransferase